jgi:molybdopterin-biosynthesis enzyme MoeA-like protein
MGTEMPDCWATDMLEKKRGRRREEREKKRASIPQASSALPDPQGINWGADSVGAADSELTSS